MGVHDIKGRALSGGIITLILILGLVYGLTMPFFYDPSWVQRQVWTPSEGKTITYNELIGEEMPGIAKVDLNIKVRSGSLTCDFTDSPYIYRLIFRTDTEAAQPVVFHSRRGNNLKVDVILDNGDAKIQLSESYFYNGFFEWGAGGAQIILNKHTRIDALYLKIKYAGFISIDIRDKAMFNLIDIDLNTGGLNLRVDTDRLYGKTEVNAKLTFGGILIPSISIGKNVGIKAMMDIDIGGLNLKTAGFQVLNKTLTHMEMISENYEYASSKLALNFNIGLGGISFNIPPYQISPEVYFHKNKR